MAKRSAVFFDLPPDMKNRLNKRFEGVKTNWGEIFRESTRMILDMSDEDIYDFLLDAKQHDLEDSLNEGLND